MTTKIYRIKLIHERIISAENLEKAETIFRNLINRDLGITSETLNHYGMKIECQYKGE